MYHVVPCDHYELFELMKLETLRKMNNVLMVLQIIKQTSYNFSTYRKQVDEASLTDEEAQEIIKIYDEMVLTVAREISNYQNPVL